MTVLPPLGARILFSSPDMGENVPGTFNDWGATRPGFHHPAIGFIADGSESMLFRPEGVTAWFLDISRTTEWISRHAPMARGQINEAAKLAAAGSYQAAREQIRKGLTRHRQFLDGSREGDDGLRATDQALSDVMSAQLSTYRPLRIPSIVPGRWVYLRGPAGVIGTHDRTAQGGGAVAYPDGGQVREIGLVGADIENHGSFEANRDALESYLRSIGAEDVPPGEWPEGCRGEGFNPDYLPFTLRDWDAADIVAQESGRSHCGDWSKVVTVKRTA